jgi:hypothetical protein
VVLLALSRLGILTSLAESYGKHFIDQGHGRRRVVNS